MPNGRPDDAPVTWGRWNEAHQAVLHRLDQLDDETRQQFNRIRASEEAVARAEEHRRDLEGQVDQMTSQIEARRSHLWTLGTIILTSLLLPLLVTVLSVALHLRITH